MPFQVSAQDYESIKEDERIDFLDHENWSSWLYDFDGLSGNLFEYCANTDGILFFCDKYAEHAISMLPKIHRIIDRVEERFDISRKEDLLVAIQLMLADKYTDLETSKAKFTLSLMWYTVQRTLHNSELVDSSENSISIMISDQNNQ